MNPESTLSIQEFDTKLASSNEKLEVALDFMRQSLQQSPVPFFQGFWHARQQGVNLFKDAPQSPTRAKLWNEFHELCIEFRRIKEVLDEQASFATEQIGIAIKACAKEIDSVETLVQSQPIVEIKAKTLQSNHCFYETTQRELSLLNAFAARINALRKELIKCEIRIRIKNKFFKELSALGDKVFPKRKSLIEAQSQQFQSDVEEFIKRSLKGPPYLIKEEIRNLQMAAKELTLSTAVFSSTRVKLSEVWDQIKVVDAERRKELAEKKVLFKQNYDSMLAKIEELKAEIAADKIGVDFLSQKQKEMHDLMRSLQLGRDEKNQLIEALTAAFTPLEAKLKEQEDERLRKEEAVAKERTSKVQAFKTSVEQLLSSGKEMALAKLIEESLRLQEECKTLPANKNERIPIEKLFRAIKELIKDREEEALLQLSENDLSSLNQLKEALKQRQERRKQVKEHLEQLRRTKGGSSLSFERALAFDEMVREERLTLEKIEKSIDEIEEKIAQISSKI